MFDQNDGDRKTIVLGKAIIFLSLCVILISLTNICVLSINVDSIAYLDILYTSIHSEFVFTNTTNRVETVHCDGISQCIDKLEEISKRAKNVVSYSSVYNLTRTPFDSISHYTRNTIYFSLSLTIFSFIFSCLIFHSMRKIENDTFLLYDEY